VGGGFPLRGVVGAAPWAPLSPREQEQMLYETKLRIGEELDWIEVEYEIDEKEEPEEATEIMIFRICLVKKHEPRFPQRDSLLFSEGYTERLDIFQFVSLKNIAQLADEIKAMLKRKDWEDVFRMPIPR
jgi:hypothetical protein